MTNQQYGPGEFVVFRIGSQEFCIEISAVREIRGWSRCTLLPHSPEALIGVINLRGTILPIVDLAKRLGLPSQEPTERHVTVVIESDNRSFGIVVDSVSDIVDVGPDSIRPLPDLEYALADHFFSRIITLDDRVICEIIPERIIVEDDELAA